MMHEDDLLTAQSEVLRLPSPATRVKNVVHAYLKHERCLQGLGERAFFDDPSDFVALRPAKGEDRLSQFLRDHCNWMFEVSATARTLAPIKETNTLAEEERPVKATLGRSSIWAGIKDR